MPNESIRPFRINVAQSELDDLRGRILATKWPEPETVSDNSQGVPLDLMQDVARYWATDYDWRRCEARLNALPNFMTTIDGLDIHFIHVRSPHQNAMPLIVTHGWPGSVIEQLKLIEPLTNPTAHGGSAEDAFDVVIPSIPGYGFSGKPTETGWDEKRTGRAWIELMKRLGYTRFVAQGGDIGSPITQAMAVQAPPELLGIHVSFASTIPADVGAALARGEPAPADLSAEERRAFEQVKDFQKCPRRLRPHAEHAPANALWANGFACRVGGLDDRSRRRLRSAGLVNHLRSPRPNHQRTLRRRGHP
jgi:pimeloyl-ACP methyl ester carboxylesterase